jgi:YD repeat-containing protein
VDGVTNGTLTSYDELDQRIAEKDEPGIVTGFRYDKVGRLLAVTQSFVF